MNAETHLEKARRLEASIEKLDSEEDWELVVEGIYGAMQHYIAVVCEKKIGKHIDTHKGLVRFLRENAMTDISNIFLNIDELRIGRWYGKKTNGETSKLAKELLGKIKEIAKDERESTD